MDINGILQQSCGAMVEDVMKSTIQQPMAGMACFGRERLEKLAVVGYYNGTLFYQNLYGRGNHDRVFGEGAL